MILFESEYDYSLEENPEIFHGSREMGLRSTKNFLGKRFFFEADTTTIKNFPLNASQL